MINRRRTIDRTKLENTADVMDQQQSLQTRVEQPGEKVDIATEYDTTDETVRADSISPDVEVEESQSFQRAIRVTQKGLLHFSRKRKAIETAQRQLKLLRMPLKNAAVASPQSDELWGLIRSVHNGRFQVEEVYLVTPELMGLLDKHLRPIKVQVILNQDGSYSLLYTKLTDGYENSWMDSAEACSEQLEQGWGRVISDRAQQEYVYVPVSNGKPVPAAESFPDLEETIKHVFADRTVSDLTHPVLEEMGIYIDPDLLA